MVDPILTAFLTQQHEQAMDLAKRSGIMDIVPVDGTPPNKYLVDFNARGLVRGRNGEIDCCDRCTVGIWMPENYLRDDWDEVLMPILTYVGPHPVPWHPNICIRPGEPHYICAHVKPCTPIGRLLYAAYEIWTWKLLYTGDDGLNPEASAWARRQDRSRFPVDPRPLVARTRTPQMTVNVRQTDPVKAARKEGGVETE